MNIKKPLPCLVTDFEELVKDRIAGMIEEKPYRVKQNQIIEDIIDSTYCDECQGQGEITIAASNEQGHIKDEQSFPCECQIRNS